MIEHGICPRCGGKLMPRTGRYGNFYGCSNYNDSVKITEVVET